MACASTHSQTLTHRPYPKKITLHSEPLGEHTHAHARWLLKRRARYKHSNMIALQLHWRTHSRTVRANRQAAKGKAHCEHLQTAELASMLLKQQSCQARAKAISGAAA
jgi:hypothetical protein